MWPFLLALLGGSAFSLTNEFIKDQKESKERADAEAQETARNKLYADLNNEFFTNIDNWSSKDIARFMADNQEWASDNNAIVNNYMTSKTRQENYSKDLEAQIKAYRDNGVNPMLAYSNLGGASQSFNLQSSDTSYQDEMLELKRQALQEQQNMNDNNFLLKMLSVFLLAKRFF